MVQGPLHGDTRISHCIGVEGKVVAPKIDVWASTPISCPLSYELPISRMKRGGVEFTMAMHILQASLVWSVPLLPECPCWLPHTPGPSALNLSPLIQQGCSRKCLKDSTKLPVPQPRGVPAVCQWAGGRHSTLCGASKASLLPGVCSSRVVMAHLACSACMALQRGVPLQGWWEKASFEEHISILSTGSSWGMKGHHQWPGIALLIIPSPTGPSLSSSPCRHWL